MPTDMTADIGLRCPSCADSPPLQSAGGPLQALRCGRCGSAQVPPRGVTRLRLALGDTAAGLDDARSARSVNCAACGRPSPLVPVEAGFAAPCAACGTVWVEGPVLAWAEARIRARPSSPASPFETFSATLPTCDPSLARTAAPRSVLASPRFLVPAALLVGLSGAGALWLLLRGWPGSSVASAEDESSLAMARSPAPSPAVLRSNLLAGGRPLAWWKDRLERLHRASDRESQDLYRATFRRAQANGLVVTVEGSEVTVEPGDGLLRALGTNP